jgi:hypothetical protein
MNNAILEFVLAAGAAVSAVAVGLTCLVGLAVWIGGVRQSSAK